MKKIFLLILLSTAMILPAAERLLLPELIYAAPGLETNIYFVNAFHTVNPQNYAFIVKCEKGTLETKRWCWTPAKTDAGKKFPLTLEIYDDNGLVESASAVVSVAPDVPKKDKFTLALLGASGVNCLYPDHMLKVMREKGYTGYTPVGSHSGHGKKVVPGGVAHDGYGGWTWGSFLHSWYSTEKELNSIQNKAEREQMRALGVWDVPDYAKYRLRSPLLKLVNGKLVDNVQGWLDKINGGKAPDIIMIHLGGNDVWRFSDEELDFGIHTQVIANMNELLNRLRQIAPDAQIGLVSGMYGCSQDAFGVNYGCKLSRYRYRKNVFAYNKMLIQFIKKRNDPKMTLIPLHYCVDPENSYLQKKLPAHARSSKMIVRDRNALHQSLEGGMQIGDAACCWLLHHLPWNNK